MVGAGLDEIVGDKSSAELLRIIAETLGVDVATLAGWRSGGAIDMPAETLAESHRAMMLFRMVRAFRALPDGESRQRAIQFVESLSAPPVRAD